MNDFTAQDFIHDFLEEAAEHLQSIGQNLLTLEESLRQTNAPVVSSLAKISAVNELFRSFHTLKGLAGMVGLRQAEELSHGMESVLRGIQQAEVEITGPVIEQLFQAVRALEAAIATLRDPNAAMPEIGPYLQALAGLLPVKDQKPAASASPAPARIEAPPNGFEPGPVFNPVALEPIFSAYPELSAHLSEVEQQQLQAALADGKIFALAIFTSSVEKAEHGLNVNGVRQKLAEAGEVIKAMPIIRGASMRFAFLIASAQPLDPADFMEMEWVFVSPSELAAGEAPAARTGDNGKSAPGAQTSPTLVLEPNQAVETGQGLAASMPALSATVRVELSRLDELMRLVSDLVVARSRISDVLPRLQGASPKALDTLNQSIGKMERNLRDLRQAVVRTRMVPLAEVFSHMPLAVRDLGRASGKEVRLVMEGENTEVDKVLVERLLDPLLHLVRNVIVHGIEPPDERIRAGKAPQGTLTLRGQPAGDHILISVSDDGQGIDAGKVAAKAAAMGWLDGQPARSSEAALSDAELLELICRPGLSTRLEADLGAGRGVGMEVVARAVSSLGGSLGLQTAPGQGTTFTLRLPLTLTIVDALLVRCGEERYAMPQSAVEEVIEVEPERIVQVEGGELFSFRGSSLTLIRLADLFHLQQPASPRFLYGLISASGERRTALVVDQVIGLREVVVRTIADPLVARPGIAGATELGDGSVILILDFPSLLSFAKRVSSERMPSNRIQSVRTPKG